MEDIAIRVTGLSKLYEKKRRKAGLFGLGKSIAPVEDNEVWALKDVSFEINKGESVGIIGRNGSGKSTLLRVLSGITTPTQGRVEIYGRVASILDLNSNFHPELSGRENVFMSGTMLGMKKKDITAKFDEIVEFSGISEFIDTPVKYYSNGMFVRLAFSCVVYFDADIYLFDEVLLAGDVEFQNKSIQKIIEIVNLKKTVIAVSHSLQEIIETCPKVFVINEGKFVNEGSDELVHLYSNNHNKIENIKNDTAKISQTETGIKHSFKWESKEVEHLKDIKPIELIVKCNGELDFSEITVEDNIEIEFKYIKITNNDYFDIGFIFSYLNKSFFCVHSLISELEIEMIVESGFYVAKTIIPKRFFNKTSVSLGLSITKNVKDIVYFQENIIFIRIEYKSKRELDSIYYSNLPFFHGPIRLETNWLIEKKSNEFR